MIFVPSCLIKTGSSPSCTAPAHSFLGSLHPQGSSLIPSLCLFLVGRITSPDLSKLASIPLKSQGKTLDRVKVDFSRIFEKGQAYVAASRCRQLETLQITHFKEELYVSIGPPV